MTASAWAEFLCRFEDKTRWRGNIADRGKLAKLPGWEMLDATLRGPGFPTDRLRIMLDERRVAPTLYVDATNGVLRAAAVQGLAEQGATFVIDGLSSVIAPLADLARAIERDLAGNVNCSAYVSFGERSAFLPHYDDHDVLIIHLQGVKAWRGYGQGTVRFPIRRGPNQRVETPEWEDVLPPGGLLYLPRGEVHAAVPVEWPSVHLTIGIGEKTGVDFVRSLTEAAETQDIFRHSLSRHRTAAQEQELKQAMHALVDTASLDAFLARDDQQRRLKPAAAFNFARRLGPDTHLASTLLRRPPLHLDEQRDMKLVLGGQAIRLTQLERRALDQLTQVDQLSHANLARALALDPEDAALAMALATLATHTLIEICRA